MRCSICFGSTIFRRQPKSAPEEEFEDLLSQSWSLVCFKSLQSLSGFLICHIRPTNKWSLFCCLLMFCRMWFHKPVKADDWLLYVVSYWLVSSIDHDRNKICSRGSHLNVIFPSWTQIDSPSAHGGRGFVTGRMFNRQGEVCTFISFFQSFDCDAAYSLR